MHRIDRKLETWAFRVDGRREPVPVDVRIQSSAQGKYTFIAFCDEPRFERRHTDLGELYALVEAAVRGTGRFRWQPKLRLTAEVDRQTMLDEDEPGECRITVECDTLAVALHEGKWFERRHPESTPYERPQRRNTPRGEVDDTPENRAAIVRLLSQVEAAGERLAALLTPAALPATLRAVGEGAELFLDLVGACKHKPKKEPRDAKAKGPRKKD